MTGSLLIRGGHIIDPSQGVDEVGSLLITEGNKMQCNKEKMQRRWLGLIGVACWWAEGALEPNKGKFVHWGRRMRFGLT